MADPKLHRFPLIRLLFFGAVLFALVMASLPQPPQIPGQPSDKVQHIIAFVVLTVLARAAYPAVHPWKILVSLGGFGALIEAVQAIPALHRDASMLDWLADCMAVAVTLCVLAIGLKRVGAVTPAPPSS